MLWYPRVLDLFELVCTIHIGAYNFEFIIIKRAIVNPLLEQIIVQFAAILLLGSDETRWRGCRHAQNETRMQVCVMGQLWAERTVINISHECAVHGLKSKSTDAAALVVVTERPFTDGLICINRLWKAFWISDKPYTWNIDEHTTSHLLGKYNAHCAILGYSRIHWIWEELLRVPLVVSTTSQSAM